MGDSLRAAVLSLLPHRATKSWRAVRFFAYDIKFRGIMYF